ncbi:MAG TPA: oxidoreductase, partial [Actinomycetes bacterium]|nr:oxidoreductase [Actinomycetes bacterium]
MRLSSLFRRQRPGTLRTADRADADHLSEFARSRRGVEAFVEPRTTVTDTTVVLVAHDGEWTRRRVASA